MFKKTLLIISILFIFFAAGCGSSSTGSSNNPPESNFLNDVDSAFNELVSAADSFYGNYYYSSIFDDNGMFTQLETYLYAFREFTLADPDFNDNSKWEAEIPDPKKPTQTITYLGEFVADNVFWIRSSEISTETDGIFIYTDTKSIKINLPGDPTNLTSDPNIRAELYKSGNDYYGFLLKEGSTDNFKIVKIKYNISDPAQLFLLKYGDYVPEDSNFSFDDYDFIRERPDAETWFSPNPENPEFNLLVDIELKDGIFDFDTYL